MAAVLVVYAVFLEAAGARGLAIQMGIFGVIALVMVVVIARAALSSSRAASVHGRDVYEREALTKPIFGAYENGSRIARVVGLSTLTIFLTIPLTMLFLPFWAGALIRVLAFFCLYAAVSSYGRIWGRRTVAGEMSARTEARELPAGTAPHVEEALATISVALGLTRPPALRLIPTGAVNAWVTGPRELATVAVSEGMLAALSQSEMEAVIADLLVRANDPLVSEYTLALGWVPRGLLPSRPPHADASRNAVALYSAADDVALFVLRDPTQLIDALQRTRLASSREIPGVGPEVAHLLWAWPLDVDTTTDYVDVQAERIRALRAVAEVEVRQALAEPVPERPEWYYLSGQERQGPLTEGELSAAIRDRSGSATALVWKRGMLDWQPAEVALGPGGPILADEHPIPPKGLRQQLLTYWIVPELVFAMMILVLTMSGVFLLFAVPVGLATVALYFWLRARSAGRGPAATQADPDAQHRLTPNTFAGPADNRSSAGEWYYLVGDAAAGPVEQSAILAMVGDGRLGKDSRVWSTGEARWLTVGTAFGQNAAYESDFVAPLLSNHPGLSQEDVARFLGGLTALGFVVTPNGDSQLRVKLELPAEQTSLNVIYLSAEAGGSAFKAAGSLETDLERRGYSRDLAEAFFDSLRPYQTEQSRREEQTISHDLAKMMMDEADVLSAFRQLKAGLEATA
jgi:hypothetical protein